MIPSRIHKIKSISMTQFRPQQKSLNQKKNYNRSLKNLKYLESRRHSIFSNIHLPSLLDLHFRVVVTIPVPFDIDLTTQSATTRNTICLKRLTKHFVMMFGIFAKKIKTSLSMCALFAKTILIS
jgi:hypothetical protein